ncbi:serine hydrolase domain-containing protein [Lederbergia graminis]|uniref:Serine hydrolase domain-containing protein n=1 Tax=Lederbergia graminis TaxID=735518 RepID=A0ABW0LK85_9BACI
MQKDEWVDNFETYATKIINDFHLPGVAVGLASHGQVYYEKSFGYRDVEQQLQVTSDTVFAIGSITKTFTCAAILQLQERGKIHVHDPISNYLPEFRHSKDSFANRVTIHHLMTHTSGIPDLQTFPMVVYDSLTEDDFKYDPTISGEKKSIQPLRTTDEYLQYLSQLDFQLLSNPGERWHYSNDGYGLLGIIIERVSGQTYEKYLHENILEPSRMKHTSFFLDQYRDENVTKLYVLREEEGNSRVVASPNWWDAPVMRSAGFLKSTISDMLKFAEIFRTDGIAVGGERILATDSIKQMARVHTWKNPIIRQGYGYGLCVFPNYHGTTLLEHAGGIKGGGAQMFILPEKGLSGIILTNILSTAPTSLMNGMLNGLDNRQVESSHVTYENAPAEEELVTVYIGRYQSEHMNLSVSIKLIDHQLQIQVFDSLIRLKTIQKDTFLLEGTLDCIQFKRNKENQIIALDYKGIILKFVQGGAA